LPGAFAAPQRLAVARGSIRLDWLACESL
jgi:hypothetical protein